MTQLTGNNDSGLSCKFIEFNQAIQKYTENLRYKHFQVFVSFFIVVLQIVTLFNVIVSSERISLFSLIFSLMVAYVFTDLINGLVHMYMDNNTSYKSVFGPYIAAFHLHHAKYNYQIRHPLRIYFDESGTKFWLLGYLLILVSAQLNVHLNVSLNCGLVAFGIFSTLAELSHYWCHMATEKNKRVLWLQKHFILLSKERHKAHHCSDNTQYAFLNGLTDPLINCIARYFYKGYKNHADKHTKHYMQQLRK